MIRIGVICPSEIAFRRFMPAVSLLKDKFEFIGIGVSTAEERFGSDEVNQELLDIDYEKAKQFTDTYGGKIYDGYANIVNSDDIDAIYIPLPPALHYKWAKAALNAGKHVLLEKPFTTSSADTEELISIARERNLALHENYMFAFHNQLKEIAEIVSKGEIGDVRLYRISFGFPMRAANDFRYKKALGGGSLIDCGGYPIKYASMLIGETAHVAYANLNYIDGFEVDMYGSAALINDDGVTAQIAFGMDNEYKCELEIWGSKGTLKSDRILTAPVGFVPEITIRNSGEERKFALSADDSFKKSIEFFHSSIFDNDVRLKNYNTINKQAQLIEEFKSLLK